MQSIGSILIIDDELTFADLLIEILTDERYQAYTVPNGVSLLVASTLQPLALILLDMGRPGLRGATWITDVREAILATTPIVVMTTAPRVTTPLRMPGAVECLYKPFDIDELLACVARYVQPAHAAALCR